MNRPAPGALPARLELLMVEVDEIFHHVFDGLRAGIDGVDFEAGIAHG